MLNRKSFIKTDNTATEELTQWLLSAISELSDGQYVIDIQEAKKKRSNDQNRLFHWWCRIIAEDTGASVNDVKDYFKTKFLMRPNPMGSGFIVGSTSTLKKADFATFLEEIHAEASTEFGIYLPSEADRAYDEYFGKEL